MTSFEWLTVAYLAAITAAGWWRQAPRRLRAAGYAALAIALVIVARFTAPSGVRVWLPHLYLVLGYWLPALLTPVPMSDGFQRALAAADARVWSAAQNVVGRPLEPVGTVGSSSLGSSRYILSGALGWFELAYLLCYPIVPISFIAVRVKGTEDDTVRFGSPYSLPASHATVLFRGPLHGPLDFSRPGFPGGSPRSTCASSNISVMASTRFQAVTWPWLLRRRWPSPPSGPKQEQRSA